MKLKLLSTALVTTVALSACKSTPEEDMSLPVGFEQQAQLMPLKRPVLTLTDEAWHQAIGPFQLTNMDLSGKSTEKVSTSTGWQTTARGGLLFQLMFHDEVNLSGDVVNKFNTRAEQSFSFDLQAQGAAAVHAECQILVFGQGEETLDNGVNSYNWQTSEQQLSYLGCKLTQDGQVSTLVVEDKAGTAPVYKLNPGQHSPDGFAGAGSTGTGEIQFVFSGRRIRLSGWRRPKHQSGVTAKPGSVAVMG